jgi:hypothetical protein
MKKFLLGCLAAVALFSIGIKGAWAQASDLSSSPVVTLTSAGPATTNSGIYENLGQGMTCMLVQSAHTGTTQSTTLAIQQYDPATAGFLTIAISAAITADATPNVITIYPTVGPASVPTGMVFLNYKGPPLFRVQVVETGSASTVTTKVGCTILK